MSEQEQQDKLNKFLDSIEKQVKLFQGSNKYPSKDDFYQALYSTTPSIKDYINSDTRNSYKLMPIIVEEISNYDASIREKITNILLRFKNELQKPKQTSKIPFCGVGQ